MASLVFNSAKLGILQRTLDLTEGTYYAELVTTAPTDPTLVTKSQVVLASGGNYTPFLFAGTPALSVLNNAAVADFSTDPIWNNLVTDGSGTIKGSVICKQVGGSPAASDPLIVYNALATPATPSGVDLELVIPTTGFWRLFSNVGLVFTSTLLGLFQRTIDLTSGTFYAHLLTAAPASLNITTVAELSLASGGNYGPVELNELSFSMTGNTAVWGAGNPSWLSLSTNNAASIKGIGVCKQMDVEPSSSDPALCYKALSPTQFPNGYTPNGATFTVPIAATTGLIRLP